MSSSTRKLPLLPSDAEYPWVAEGNAVFGYFEPPPDVDPEDLPDRMPVAWGRTPEVARAIAHAYNFFFRMGNQR